MMSVNGPLYRDDAQLMKLEPGAMRELHWHATAAEWAFVIEGRVRTTVIDPQGRSPRPTTSSRATSGTSPAATATCSNAWATSRCHFILIFDNGYFSRVRHVQHHRLDRPCPEALLAKNFGLPEESFDGFPKDEVYFARGAIPPPSQAVPLARRGISRR